MNIKKEKKIIIIILITLFILAFGFWLQALRDIARGDTGKNIFGEQILNPGTIVETDFYRGIIASSTIKGYSTYISKKYGVRFSFPEEWGGRGYLDGSVAFANYPASEYPDFALTGTDGRSQISAWFEGRLPYGAIGEFSLATMNKQEKEKRQVMVDGQPADRWEIKAYLWGRDAHVLTYFITLPPQPLQDHRGYLRFDIYGDPANFYILDEMVKTIKWLPVEKE